MENVSQCFTGFISYYAFCWASIIFIDTVPYLFNYWRKFWLTRHHLFNTHWLNCFSSKLYRLPLGHTLVQNGAALPQVAVLMSTLMAVGLASLPMEQKTFGHSFAYARNISAIIMSLLFALIIWVVMT